MEAEIQAPGDRSLPDHLQEELEALRIQMQDLSNSSSQAIAENEDLVHQMANLQNDYERKLHDREVDTTLRVEELQNELTRLDSALEKANNQLAQASKDVSSIPRKVEQVHISTPLNSSSTSDAARHQLEAELLTAQNKSDWLKRENNQLELRCRTA